MTYRDPKTGRWAVPHPFGDNGGGLSQPLPRLTFEPCLVFVYGTLKRGFGNHHCLDDAEFVGTAHTKENFVVFSTGIPYVARLPYATHSVAGEVYRVTTRQVIDRLDRLEGYVPGRLHNHYDRELIDIIVNGEERKAYIYLGDAVRLGQVPQSSPYIWRVHNEDGHLDWRQTW